MLFHVETSGQIKIYGEVVFLVNVVTWQTGVVNLHNATVFER